MPASTPISRDPREKQFSAEEAGDEHKKDAADDEQAEDGWTDGRRRERRALASTRNTLEKGTMRKPWE